MEWSLRFMAKLKRAMVERSAYGMLLFIEEVGNLNANLLSLKKTQEKVIYGQVRKQGGGDKIRS